MSQLPTEIPALPELTSHAMLVPWGMFARQIGLVETLIWESGQGRAWGPCGGGRTYGCASETA